jgi:ubiquinone/menaquinone biosynthesis C-methylase UbiE
MIVNDTSLPGFFPATAMPDADWWQALWPNPQQTLASLGIRGYMEAVDLCYGDGLFTALLALMSRHVIAIDIDLGMLTLAQAKITKVRATNCDFILGDAYAVAELVKYPVDFVLMANTFHGVPDKPRLASGVATILKSRGSFAIVNWHHRAREETTVLGQARGPKTEMRMTPTAVAASVESAGLHLARVVDLPPYHYGAIFEKES